MEGKAEGDLEALSNAGSQRVEFKASRLQKMVSNPALLGQGFQPTEPTSIAERLLICTLVFGGGLLCNNNSLETLKTKRTGKDTPSKCQSKKSWCEYTSVRVTVNTSRFTA